MADQQFKPGDTVRLKSGGPLMTVHSIESHGAIWCEWFDQKNQPQGKSFLAATLVADDGGRAGPIVV
jgi:uncharacterized protein YodC (DUF2158 family)